eukprot:6177725-Pleurochrysis_carterae.AAC.3
MYHICIFSRYEQRGRRTVRRHPRLYTPRGAACGFRRLPPPPCGVESATPSSRLRLEAASRRSLSRRVRAACTDSMLHRTESRKLMCFRRSATNDAVDFRKGSTTSDTPVVSSQQLLVDACLMFDQTRNAALFKYSESIPYPRAIHVFSKLLHDRRRPNSASLRSSFGLQNNIFAAGGPTYSKMAYAASAALMELRVHMCQNSVASKGVR